MVASGSPASSRLETHDGILAQAHTLPGDQLQAGPVLLRHQAVWVEAGQRLLVRSLDVHGRTRTLFSTSKTPGAPKGIVWPFDVQSIAAGGGRFAFVENVTECASAPPHTPRCAPVPGGERWPYSVTVFAGRPGAIRPVETVAHPGCRGRSVPQAVEIARAGLVVDETRVTCGPRPPVLSRVLRSFSGAPVRVLARGNSAERRMVVAGDWALITSEYGEPGPVKIVRLSTGKTMLWLRRQCWLRFTDGRALNSSGEFALMNDSEGPGQGSCQRQRGNIVRVGRIGNSRMRVLATQVGEVTSSTSIAIAGGYVAYGRKTGPAPSDAEVMIAGPDAAPAPIPGLTFGPLAFDGRVVATAHDDIVQLAAIHRR